MARRSARDTALAAIKRMTDLEELRRVKAAAEERIADHLEKPEEDFRPREQTIETRLAAQGHYALELVKCGKDRCRCANGGKLHGPYWYLYRHVGNRKYSKTYIGRELPAEAKS